MLRMKHVENMKNLWLTVDIMQYYNAGKSSLVSTFMMCCSSFPETRVICIRSNHYAFIQKTAWRIWNLWTRDDFGVSWQSLRQAESLRDLKCWRNKRQGRSLTSICWWRGRQTLRWRSFEFVNKNFWMLWFVMNMFLLGQSFCWHIRVHSYLSLIAGESNWHSERLFDFHRMRILPYFEGIFLCNFLRIIFSLEWHLFNHWLWYGKCFNWFR